jgi:hypothetical protein
MQDFACKPARRLLQRKVERGETATRRRPPSLFCQVAGLARKMVARDAALNLVLANLMANQGWHISPHQPGSASLRLALRCFGID